MSGYNYIDWKKGRRLLDEDFKVDTNDIGNSGWDLHRFYKTLPNGKPMPKDYTRKRPYGDKA